MGGFLYNGKSTKDILTDELLLETFDEGQITIETNRNIVSGDVTISKPISNEYGTTYENLVIKYGLVKKNGNRFSDEEQQEIEKWLTAPKLSTDLQLYDDQYNNTEIYSGVFTNTKWYSLGEGWIGLMFEFTCNSAYGKRYFKQDFTISSSQTITIDNPSDESEEYIYPTITLLQSNSNQNIIIRNVSDNNSMNLKINKSSEVVIDCQHCIIKDTSGSISYSDLGWEDVGNIYWLRLLPGDNQLQIEGVSSITIEFEYPCKKLGGWRL